MAAGYVVYGLREIYSELGEYEFKVVLDPKQYSDGHESEMDLVDSDGNQMRYTLRKWGRKLNCVFTVDLKTADGVSSINMELKDKKGLINRCRLSMWIIKP